MLIMLFQLEMSDEYDKAEQSGSMYEGFGPSSFGAGGVLRILVVAVLAMSFLFGWFLMRRINAQEKTKQKMEKLSALRPSPHARLFNGDVLRRGEDTSKTAPVAA